MFLPEKSTDPVIGIKQWIDSTTSEHIPWVVTGTSEGCGANPYAISSPRVVYADSPEQALTCLLTPEFLEMSQDDYVRVISEIKDMYGEEQVTYYEFVGKYLAERYYKGLHKYVGESYAVALCTLNDQKSSMRTRLKQKIGCCFRK